MDRRETTSTEATEAVLRAALEPRSGYETSNVEHRFPLVTAPSAERPRVQSAGSEPW